MIYAERWSWSSIMAYLDFSHLTWSLSWNIHCSLNYFSVNHPKAKLSSQFETRIQWDIWPCSRSPMGFLTTFISSYISLCSKGCFSKLKVVFICRQNRLSSLSEIENVKKENRSKGDRLFYTGLFFSPKCKLPKLYSRQVTLPFQKCAQKCYFAINNQIALTFQY